MTEMVYEFTDKDKKIRKKWKRCALIVLVLFPVLFFILTYMLDVIEGEGYEDSLLMFWVIVKNLFWLWALNHFAYKKYGTALLGWAIGTGILSLIIYFCKFNKNEPIELMGFILEVGLMIWFFVRCSKLQDLNHRIKKSVEDYKEEAQ